MGFNRRNGRKFGRFCLIIREVGLLKAEVEKGINPHDPKEYRRLTASSLKL